MSWCVRTFGHMTIRTQLVTLPHRATKDTDIGPLTRFMRHPWITLSRWLVSISAAVWVPLTGLVTGWLDSRPALQMLARLPTFAGRCSTALFMSGGARFPG